MKPNIKRTLTSLVLVFAIAASFCAAIDPPADDYSASYKSPISSSRGLKNLQDATPAVGFIALPDANAYTTNLTLTWNAATTQYVATATNLVQISKYRPLDWGTTNWPIASSNGIAYGILVMTNPPTASGSTITNVAIGYNNVTITNELNGTTNMVPIVTIGTVSTSVFSLADSPISNLWYNTTPGVNTGWKMVQ